MSVTMATAITEVRALLDEASPGIFWTDDQIQSWVNQGCSDIARRAEILWEEANIQCVANLANYPFAADFLNCHRAAYTINPPIGSPGAMTQALEFREINSMDENWGMIQSLPAAWPRWFTIRGNSVVGFFLQMYPAPASPGELTVYYYRQAKTITDTSQNIDTLSGWEDIVYDYGVYKAQRAASTATWKDAYQLYEKNIAEMINKTRNMTDQMNQVTSGQQIWPIYAYADPDTW